MGTERKRLTIVHGFRPETENFDFGKSTSQGEHIGTNFSFIAPFSEEYKGRKE